MSFAREVQWMMSGNALSAGRNEASPVVSFAWPREMRPGDQRFVANALRIRPSRKRVRVTYLFDAAVRVSGPSCVAPNAVDVSPSRHDRAIGLMFSASPDSQPGCRVDVALSVTRRRIGVWRTVGACALALSAVLPAAVHIMQWPFLRVSLSVGDAVALTIPAGVLMAGVMVWQRVTAVIARLLVIELAVDECVSQIGDDVPHITLRATVSDSGIAELDISERAAWSDRPAAEK